MINTLGWNITIELEIEDLLSINHIINIYTYGINYFNSNFKKLDFNKLFSLASSVYNYDNTSKNSFDIYIPVKLFFNKDYSLSLPITFIKHQTIIIEI